MKIEKILNQIELIAPPDTAMGFDNVGLLIGYNNLEVSKVLLALDLTEEVLEEALQEKVNLIITHHPIIFSPIKNINNETYLGRLLLKLIESKISVYTAHTNLDLSNTGTNDVLFEKLNLTNKEFLDADPSLTYDLGRVGTLEQPLELKDLATFVKKQLGLSSVRFTGEENKIIKKVGLCTGSGSDTSLFQKAKAKNCDVFITGDITYHKAQDALNINLALIDGTHFATEAIVLQSLQVKLRETLGTSVDFIVSEYDGQVFKNI